MVEDLIKRLRDTVEEEAGHGVRNEAADLIEQQAARIAELSLVNFDHYLCADAAKERLTALESERDALLAAAGKEAVGEIAHDEVNGFHFAPSVHWLQIGIGTKLYTAPTAALEKGGGRDAWISVDERLPEERQVVLVFRPDAHLLPACDPNIDCRCYFGNGVFNGIHPVTHWMPLPAPPAALYQKANDGLSLRAQHEDACIAANNNAQDAERYRWLRTLDSDFGNRNRMSEMARFYGETLDEAIDAALSQKAGEQQ